MEKISYLVKRLAEPSTWVAIGAAAAAVGVHVPTTLGKGIMYVGMGVGLVLGVLLPEKSNK